MPNQFEDRFEKALISFSVEYRQIRDQLVAMPEQQVKLVDTDSPDYNWRVQLHYDIIQGWRKHPETFQLIRRIANGTDESLQGGKYLTGRPPIDVAVEALLKIDSSLSPALLEILLKEPDLLTDYSFVVCANTLISWNKRDAIPIFKEIFMNSRYDASFREMAMQPLLQFKADQLFEDFAKVFEDEYEPLELRAAALYNLGMLSDERSIPFLQRVFNDDQALARFRASAAGGLAETGDPKLISLFKNSYSIQMSDELREAIIFALLNFDDPEATDALRQIQKIEPNNGLQEIIDEEISDFEE